MLEIKNLKFAYKPTAPVLNGVDLELRDGEIGIILGKNGAGKSTLFKCLLGVLKAQGEILFDGRELKTLKRSERARLIAYVPQEVSLGYLSVFDCVMTGRISHFGTFASAADREIVERVLTDLSIEKLAYKPVNELSGGERQKVAIARALVQEPKTLIFDEPTASLDIGSEKQLMSLAKEVAEKSGISILIAIHDLNCALGFGGKFFMMKDGVIGYSGGEDILNEDTISDVYGVRPTILEAGGKKAII